MAETLNWKPVQDELDWKPVAQPVQKEKPVVAAQPNDHLSTSFRKGVATAKQTVGGLARFAGAEQYGNKVIAKAKETQELLEQAHPSAKLKDIDGVGSALGYVGENVAQMIPLAVPTIAGGLAAAAAAPVLGATGMAATGLTALGAFAPSMAIETGIISSEIDKVSGNRGHILGAAAPAAALDTVGDVVGLGASGLLKTARKVGTNIAKKEAVDLLAAPVKQSLGVRAAKTTGALLGGAAVEGSTESAQSPLETWGAQKPVFKDGQSFMDNPVKNTVGALSGGLVGAENYTPEMQSDMLESMGAGAAGGLGMSAGGKIISTGIDKALEPKKIDPNAPTSLTDAPTDVTAAAEKKTVISIANSQLTKLGYPQELVLLDKQLQFKLNNLQTRAAKEDVITGANALINEFHAKNQAILPVLASATQHYVAQGLSPEDANAFALQDITGSQISDQLTEKQESVKYQAAVKKGEAEQNILIQQLLGMDESKIAEMEAQAQASLQKISVDRQNLIAAQGVLTEVQQNAFSVEESKHQKVISAIDALYEDENLLGGQSDSEISTTKEERPFTPFDTTSQQAVEPLQRFVPNAEQAAVLKGKKAVKAPAANYEVSTKQEGDWVAPGQTAAKTPVDKVLPKAPVAKVAPVEKPAPVKPAYEVTTKIEPVVPKTAAKVSEKEIAAKYEEIADYRNGALKNLLKSENEVERIAAERILTEKGVDMSKKTTEFKDEDMNLPMEVEIGEDGKYRHKKDPAIELANPKTTTQQDKAITKKGDTPKGDIVFNKKTQRYERAEVKKDKPVFQFEGKGIDSTGSSMDIAPTTSVGTLFNNRNKVNPVKQFIIENIDNARKLGIKDNLLQSYLLGQYEKGYKALYEKSLQDIEDEEVADDKRYEFEQKHKTLVKSLETDKEVESLFKKQDKVESTIKTNKEEKSNINIAKSESELKDDGDSDNDKIDTLLNSKESEESEESDSEDEDYKDDKDTEKDVKEKDFSEEAEIEKNETRVNEDAAFQDAKEEAFDQQGDDEKSGYGEDVKDTKYAKGADGKSVELTQGNTDDIIDSDEALKSAIKSDSIQKGIVANPITRQSVGFKRLYALVDRMKKENIPASAVFSRDTAYALYMGLDLPATLEYEDRNTLSEDGLVKDITGSAVVKFFDNDHNPVRISVLGINQVIHMYEFNRQSLDESMTVGEPTPEDRQKAQKLINKNAQNIYDACSAKIDSEFSPFGFQAYIRSGIAKASEWFKTTLNRSIRKSIAELPTMLDQVFEYGDAKGRSKITQLGHGMYDTENGEITIKGKSISDLLGLKFLGLTKITTTHDKEGNATEKKSYPSKSVYAKLVENDSSSFHFDSTRQDAHDPSKGIRANGMGELLSQINFEEQVAIGQNEKIKTTKPEVFAKAPNAILNRFYTNGVMTDATGGKTIKIREAFLKELTLMLDEMPTLSKKDRDAAIAFAKEQVEMEGFNPTAGSFNGVMEYVAKNYILEKSVTNFLENAHRLRYDKARNLTQNKRKDKYGNWITTYHKAPSYKEYYAFISNLMDTFKQNDFITKDEYKRLSKELGTSSIGNYMQFIFNGLHNDASMDFKNGVSPNGTYINTKEDPWMEQFYENYLHKTNGYSFLEPANDMTDIEANTETADNTSVVKYVAKLKEKLQGMSTIPLTRGDLGFLSNVSGNINTLRNIIGQVRSTETLSSSEKISSFKEITKEFNVSYGFVKSLQYLADANDSLLDIPKDITTEQDPELTHDFTENEPLAESALPSERLTVKEVQDIRDNKAVGLHKLIDTTLTRIKGIMSEINKGNWSEALKLVSAYDTPYELSREFGKRKQYARMDMGNRAKAGRFDIPTGLIDDISVQLEDKLGGANHRFTIDADGKLILAATGNKDVGARIGADGKPIKFSNKMEDKPLSIYQLLKFIRDIGGRENGFFSAEKVERINTLLSDMKTSLMALKKDPKNYVTWNMLTTLKPSVQKKKGTKQPLNMQFNQFANDTSYNNKEDVKFKVSGRDALIAYADGKEVTLMKWGSPDGATNKIIFKASPNARTMKLDSNGSATLTGVIVSEIDSKTGKPIKESVGKQVTYTFANAMKYRDFQNKSNTTINTKTTSKLTVVDTYNAETGEFKTKSVAPALYGDNKAAADMYGLKEGEEVIAPSLMPYALEMLNIINPELMTELGATLDESEKMIEFKEGVDPKDGYRQIIDAIKNINNKLAVDLMANKLKNQEKLVHILENSGIDKALLGYMYRKSLYNADVLENMVNQYVNASVERDVTAATEQALLDAIYRGQEPVDDGTEGVTYQKKDSWDGYTTEPERNQRLHKAAVYQTIKAFLSQKFSPETIKEIVSTVQVDRFDSNPSDITIVTREAIRNSSTSMEQAAKRYLTGDYNQEITGLSAEDISTLDAIFNAYYADAFGKTDVTLATAKDEAGIAVTVSDLFNQKSTLEAKPYEVAALAEVVRGFSQRLGLSPALQNDITSRSQIGSFKSQEMQSLFTGVANLFGAKLVVVNIPDYGTSQAGGCMITQHNGEKIIVVNAARNRSMSSLVGHEVFHSVWDNMLPSEQKELRAMLGAAQNADATLSTYEKKMNVNTNQASVEVLADIFASVVFTEKFLTSLEANKNPVVKISMNRKISKKIGQMILDTIAETLNKLLKSFSKYFSGKKSIFESMMVINDIDQIVSTLERIAGNVIKREYGSMDNDKSYTQDKYFSFNADSGKTEDNRDGNPNLTEKKDAKHSNAYGIGSNTRHNRVVNPSGSSIFFVRKPEMEIDISDELGVTINQLRQGNAKAAALVTAKRNSLSKENLFSGIAKLWQSLKDMFFKNMLADQGVPNEERIYADNAANLPHMFIDKLEQKKMHRFQKRFSLMTNEQCYEFHDRIRSGETGIAEMSAWQQEFVALAKELADAQYEKVKKYSPELQYNKDHYGMFLQFRSPDVNANTQNLDFRLLHSDASIMEGNKGWQRNRGTQSPSSRIINGAIVDIVNPYDVLKNYLLQTEKFVVTNEQLKQAIDDGHAYIMGTGETIKDGFSYLNDSSTKVLDNITSMSFTELASQVNRKITGFVIADSDGNVISKTYPTRAMANQAAQESAVPVTVKSMTRALDGTETAEVGRVVMKSGLARMLNNYLSVDHIRRNRFGRALLGLKNMTTAMELSFSLFHFSTITQDYLAALQTNGYLRGRVEGGQFSKTIGGSAPMQLLRSMPLVGNAFGVSPLKLKDELHKMFTEWINDPSVAQNTAFINKANGLLGNSGADFGAICDAYYQAGGLRKQDSSLRIMKEEIEYGKGYWDSVSGIMKKTLADVEGAPKKIAIGGLKGLQVISSTTSNWLFEGYIPKVKFAVFAMEYSQKLAVNRDATSEVKHAIAVDTVKFLEKRFGEMNWNNLWMNASLKTSLQLLFRSFTWQFGTWGAFLDGMKDFKQFGVLSVKKAFGKHPEKVELTEKGCWFISAIATHIFTTTALQAIFAGFGIDDDDEKEKKSLMTRLMYPYIGNQERIKIASYPTKYHEMVEKVHMAWKTNDPKMVLGIFSGGISGFANTFMSIYNNKTFQNTYIYDPLESNILKTGADIAKFAIVSPFPMSWKSAQKEYNSGTHPAMAAFMSIGGMMKASQATYSSSEKLAFSLGGQAPPTSEDMYEQRKNLKRAAEERKLGKHDFLDKLKRKGVISPADEKKIEKLATADRLIMESSRLPFEKFILVQKSLSKAELLSKKGREFKELGKKKYQELLKSKNTSPKERLKYIALAKQAGYA